MFDARIYRAAFVPLLLVLVIVGFSLSGGPGSLHSTLAPDAFDGARAFKELRALARQFPDRRPGSPGDQRLANYVSSALRQQSGSSSGAGFQVSVQHVKARTLEGTRTLDLVVAQRPGSTGESPIAIIASRDAAKGGSSARLSSTAALLELARVFAQSETRRTIVLVSTSGGSAGDAAAARYAERAGKLDAAIVLGDLAGTAERAPLVLPFSSSSGEAPLGLQLTVRNAVSQEAGVDPGVPSVGSQLAHLAFPLPSGEEAPLNAAGIPAVLLTVTGERGPSAGEPVAEARLQGFGRAVLSATYALDEGPDVAPVSGLRLTLGHKLLPGWAIRLLVLALLLPPLVMGVDALARSRRRREPLARWVAWTLTCAAPVLVCALVAVLLGALGLVNATAGLLSTEWLAVKSSLLPAILLAAVLGLALLAWPSLPRALSLPPRPDADGAAVASMLVALAVALVVWIFNPIACLLLVVPLHVWPLALSLARAEVPRARLLAAGAIALSLVPLLLLVAAYAHELGYGLGDVLRSGALLLLAGQAGVLGTVLWSLSFGCLLAVSLIAMAARVTVPESAGEWSPISTRGPVSYAGPGSLGGTESALRR